MSLDTLQVSTSNSADVVNQASGLIRHEADETSSTIAELASMFPSLDYDVVVNVLEAHSGRIQAAVDYLMSANAGGVREDRFSGGVGGYYSLLTAEEDAVAGQFSKDIGGLPVVLPTPLYEEEGSNGGRGTTSRQSGSSEGSAGEGTRASTRDVAVRGESPPSSQQLTQASDSDPLLADDNDLLPTYQEACRQHQQPPSLSGIAPAGHEPAASRATGIRVVVPPTEEQLQAKSGHGNKKKGNKSPKSPKSPKRQKKSGSKHRGKAVQEKSGDQYQRLIDDDEDEPEL